MASFGVSFAPAAAGRVFAAKATNKSSSGGGSKEEKGFMDWILGGLQKEDQLLETDPILKKVEAGDKNNGGPTTRNNKKNSVSVPQQKKSGGFGGFGGLFAKK
ncbi:Thylakoid soluble phosphoprotein TSP9 [Macleaya cordata]|uniref:Thylakoid soluble phosphoprotein TSP9 n=1 Tax=Macleaya cordata TaxID=56857 RepID=A0A200R4P3_MACCD|nr:Thylakoid soluble phosphoprotein TSP9 [Macleaya cordata]